MWENWFPHPNPQTKACSASALTARQDAQPGEPSPGQPLSLPPVVGVAVATGELAHNFKTACPAVTRSFQAAIVWMLI